MLCNTGPVLFVYQYAGNSKTETGQRGEAGPTESWPNSDQGGTVQKSPTPPAHRGHNSVRGNHGQEVPLSQTGTEVSPTALRHCGKVLSLHLDHTCVIIISFPSLLFWVYFQGHPTVSHGYVESGREKEGNLLHAFSQLSSPQLVLCGSIPVCACQKRRTGQEERQRQKKGGPFES